MKRYLAEIRKMAESMAEEFPGHSALYYFQMLMQCSKQYKLSPGRSVMLWNAFVHLERKKAKEQKASGTFSQCDVSLLLFADVFSSIRTRGT